MDTTTPAVTRPDIDAIRRRSEGWKASRREGGMAMFDTEAPWADIDALLAEVERLKARLDRIQLRMVQDHFLSLPSVLTFIERHGEDKAFWSGGPTIREIRTTPQPDWRRQISEHNRQEGE